MCYNSGQFNCSLHFEFFSLHKQKKQSMNVNQKKIKKK